MFTKTPPPPYYAVIFTSTLKDQEEGYFTMTSKMKKLAEKEDGFLGMDSARNDLGITISYWRDLEAIEKWKTNSEHLAAKAKGIRDWYESYSVRIAKVEKEY